MKRWLPLLGLLGLLPLAAAPAIAAPSDPYVIVLKPGANPAAKAKSVGTSPSHIYKAALSGYAANLSAAQLAKVKADPAVDYVVPDDPLAFSAVGKTPPPPPAQQAQIVPFPVTRVGGLQSPTAKIDGIDERVNVDVAVLDSGIDLTHPDLNVAGGVNCSNGPSQAYGDTDGHGTEVSGTLAAIDNAIGVVGIAPGARLWSVRVLNDKGHGPTSVILCGIDWVTAHAATIRVANMSLGGKGRDDGNCGMTRRDPLHQGICAAVAAGVTIVAGAGNDAQDAATHIPAAYDEVITVSGIADSDGAPGGHGPTTFCLGDPDDAFASFSNFGADVDLAASAECVASTFNGSLYGSGTGTSFATPAVSGAAALYIATHSSASPADVRAALVARAEPGPIAGDPDGFSEGVLNVAGL